MEKVLLAIAAITLLGTVFLLHNSTGAQDQDVQTQFQAFKLKFNKKYGSEENQYRQLVFGQNLQQISAFNAKKGEEQMGVTPFSDLTDEEFVAIYLTNLQVESEPLVHAQYPLAADVPESLDWRTKGAVTPIKNQGQCGSCWAFSTTGVLEGFFQQTQGSLPSLSEQQLVDCSGLVYGNLGCQGGMPSRALRYVKSKGLTTDDVYTYKAVKGKCETQGGNYTIKGHTAIAANDAGLIAAIQRHPVSVAVDASNWKNYVSGIFDDCDVAMNHAVLAVGYGADYYLVKNSWTTQWGDAGYIKLARANTCGVLNTMVIPN